MLSKHEMIEWLENTNENEIQALFDEAYQMKLEHVGNKVFFRGIIEFSNICEKNCFYCGIRKDNKNVQRFMMSQEEIVEAAKWAWQAGYGSIVLQSGERMDSSFVDFVEQTVAEIKEVSQQELGITLSLGEQSIETYRRWFAVGAHRYLLRIETSNPELYKKLHPASHDFHKRLTCLEILRDVGYQVGTGVMSGLPYQTAEHLADDIMFFETMDIDMIGMGPYIVHNQTPLAKEVHHFSSEQQLKIGLKMIALTRLHLEDVNIASTTALQALHSQGRELGLQAGANIIMPNITNTQYRASYQLYEDKPCLDENASMCRDCLEQRVRSIGEEIIYGKWGDSPHYFKRTNDNADN